MGAFTDDLTVTQLGLNWRLFQLEQSLSYEVEKKGSGRFIIAPVGFITDGASVPQFLWAILPAWGKYSRAAVIHDYLCSLLGAGTPHPEAKSRKAADGIFYEAMGACKVNPVVRFVMWAAVRAFSIWKGFK